MVDKPNPENVNPPKPSIQSTVCPACHFRSPAPQSECQQCGLRYDLWKDPAQRKAELKLESLAKANQSGFSPTFWAVMFLVVAVPAAILFVPEVETRVRGCKLRYRPENNQVIRYAAHVSSSFYPGQPPVTMGADVQVKVTEKDSANNNCYSITYENIAAEGMRNATDRILRTDDTAVQEKMVRAATGASIETLAAVASSMQATANNIKRQNKLREEQARRYQDGWNPEESNAEAPPPPLSPAEIAQQTVNGWGVADLKGMDVSFFFHYPKERVKTGQTFVSELGGALTAFPWSGTFKENAACKIEEASRTGGRFIIKISWNAPVQVTLTTSDPVASPLLTSSAHSGTYRGSALLNYGDGFIQSYEGEFDIPLNIPPDKIPTLAASLGQSSTDGPLHLTVKQSIQRL